jgi:hypothetical protein
MRKRIPLEMFDLASLWPVRTFASFLDAQAAGYNRGSIGEVIAGRRQSHRGYGWRYADATSRVGTLIHLECRIDSSSPEQSWVSLYDFGEYLAAYFFQAVDHPRLGKMLDTRFGVVWITIPPHGSQPAGKDLVIRGLVWI